MKRNFTINSTGIVYNGVWLLVTVEKARRNARLLFDEQVEELFSLDEIKTLKLNGGFVLVLLPFLLILENNECHFLDDETAKVRYVRIAGEDKYMLLVTNFSAN